MNSARERNQGVINHLDLRRLTPGQVAVYRWLEAVAPNLSPIYLGGLRLVLDESFPGRVHLVAHAIREIGNRLPEAIAGKIDGSNTDYRTLVEECRRQWNKSSLPTDGGLLSAAEPSITEMPAASPSLIKAFAELIASHSSISSKNDQKARAMFHVIGQGDPVPDHIVKHWRDIIGQEKYAHVRSSALGPEAEAAITDVFRKLEGVLVVMSKRSYENMDELDGLLESANRR